MRGLAEGKEPTTFRPFEGWGWWLESGHPIFMAFPEFPQLKPRYDTDPFPTKDRLSCYDVGK
jgi:hypothetical protein